MFSLIRKHSGLALLDVVCPMQLKYLTCAVSAALLGSQSVVAQPATPAQQGVTSQALVIGSRGLTQPRTEASAEGDQALSPDRRVTLTQDAAPGKATAQARVAIDLPNGGMIWATEDPAVSAPVLNVSGASMVSFAEGKIQEPVSFHVYSNYADFIERMELTLYRASDRDLTRPLASHRFDPANSTDLQWQIELPAGLKARQGDELVYVLRAYAADGSMDETFPQTLQLVRPEDRQRNLDELRRSADSQFRDLSAAQLESRRLLDQSYGQGSNLSRQNISIYGSRVRITGHDVPEGYSLTINGQSIPLDQERKFVAEYLLPIGQHSFDLELKQGEQRLHEQLSVEVTGKHLFLVAIADVTASENRVTGSVQALEADDRYEDFLVEGRLGFYLKGKIKGKYLITAHADTQEQQAGDLFTGFLEANPQDVFRRLDPDAYYPVYGDDSTTTRDVDTQGKLYVRVNWDQNEALWGNFQTGITGTEYGQYVRSLYGAALKWRSKASTPLGDAKTEVRVFGSEAQTAQGHSEFLGTGGSLYYLKHTDILAGSEQVVLEVRDPVTGRVAHRAPLARDVDYQIDELQGRLILTRSLMQISRSYSPSITRDTPLGGYDNLLLVDYEYHVRGLSFGEVSAGVRAKQWFGDHLAVGTTVVDEKRETNDYQLAGMDVTLQAGRGTYIKAEQTHTEAGATTVFRSDNGGLSFIRMNVDPAREGEAQAVEARANFQELGMTEREWTVGSWYRNVDDGFSISRFDLGQRIIERGFEFSGELTEDWFVNGLASTAERGDDAYDQAILQSDWRVTDDNNLTAELRQVRETRSRESVDALLAALRYSHRITPSLELYGLAQSTLDDDGGRYENNDLASIGARYLFGVLSSVGVEWTEGARGQAATVDAEYRVASDHTVYGGYTWSSDSTGETDPLFGGQPAGLTLGQRWRVSNQTSLYNESQWLKSGNEQGIAHTYGMDFYPVENWSYGFTLQEAELESSKGVVDRRAVSMRGSHTNVDSSWNSAVEWRRDTGAEQRKQWLTTHRVSHKLNEDWRLAGRFNYSKTEDQLDSQQGAKFIESNIGFSWRPADNTRWAMLGKYSYLYDLSTFEQQDSVAWYDQRSHIVALEGIYQLDQRWKFAGKWAERVGEAREGRDQGQWYDSRARFTAVQARYSLPYKWHALAEHRWLDVREDGLRSGWLVGVDRDITQHLRIGAGYNFTDFSDDLSRHDYRYEGWYLNMVGYY